MSPWPFSTVCPGTTSIVPLTRFVLTTVPAAFARRPWSVPAAISGTGLASAASSTSRPSRKFRLTHENSPLWSRAYSPGGKFFLRDDTARHQGNGFPQHGSGPRLLAGRQAGSIHSPDKALGPKQKRHKQQKPGPQSPPPEVGPQEKKTALSFLRMRRCTRRLRASFASRR